MHASRTSSRSHFCTHLADLQRMGARLAVLQGKQCSRRNIGCCHAAQLPHNGIHSPQTLLCRQGEALHGLCYGVDKAQVLIKGCEQCVEDACTCVEL